MSLRKARAWATFWTGMVILLIALVVGVFTMPKCDYNGHILPELPETPYPNAVIVGITWVEDGVESVVRYCLLLTDASPTLMDIDSVPTLSWPGSSYANYRVYDYLPDEDDDWRESEGFQDALIESGYEAWHITLDHRWIWSNINIYDEYNNLVYEETDRTIIEDPVPEEKNFDLRSWLTGYILGLTGKPLPFGTESQEPTPEIPDGVWVTLYEGDLTTEFVSDGSSPGATYVGDGTNWPVQWGYPSDSSYVCTLKNQYYRLTVDKYSATQLATTSGGVRFGNPYVYNDVHEDTGMDFYFNAPYGVKEALFCTRYPGTFHLKFEWLEVAADG